MREREIWRERVRERQTYRQRNISSVCSSIFYYTFHLLPVINSVVATSPPSVSV